MHKLITAFVLRIWLCHDTVQIPFFSEIGARLKTSYTVARFPNAVPCTVTFKALRTRFAHFSFLMVKFPKYTLSYTKELRDPYEPAQEKWVLITKANNDGSREPSHPRSLAFTSAQSRCSVHTLWNWRRLQTKSRITGPVKCLHICRQKLKYC